LLENLLKSAQQYNIDMSKNNNRLRFVIEFENTSFQTVVFEHSIKSKSVKDNMVITVCRIGYIGDLDFEIKPSNHFLYHKWSLMLQRCHNENNKQYRKNGMVSKEWHSFSNFIEDCKTMLGYNEMVENQNIMWSIDKDFIKDENQLYSKDTCIFIPQKINCFEHDVSKNKKYNYKGFSKKDGRYTASFNFRGKGGDYLEVFINPIEAHNYYWKSKFEAINKYIERDYPFISNDLADVIYKKIKRSEQISLIELNRAILNGYFKDTM